MFKFLSMSALVLVFLASPASQAVNLDLAGAQSWEQLISSTINASSRAVLIGDTDHDSISLIRTFARLISAFKTQDSQFNCLLVEDDPRLNLAFDNYMAGRNSYEDSVLAKIHEIDIDLGRP